MLEKGSEVGAHILSGNVLEPRAMLELFPDFLQRFPHGTPVTSDAFYFLTPNSAARLPNPPQMKNHGNLIVSLSELTRWLAEEAEELGVEIYPGFAGAHLLYADDAVTGIATGDFGVSKDGTKGSSFQPGIDVMGKVTLLAEGARGSLSKIAMHKFSLRDNAQHQTYALGIKEVWRVAKEKHQPGKVIHTFGYPHDMNTYGGSFLYHMADEKVALGLVTALDYHNPYMSPYEEFQKYKQHPSVRPLLQDADVLQYGARTLNEGGLQSIPKLEFPGGALIGCAAGFLNVPKIKGTHTAQKSGMLAAEATFENLHREKKASTSGYERSVRQSWVWEELHAARNIRPGFKYGLIPGSANAALETYITRGKSPWTLSHATPDHSATKAISKCSPIEYPKPDGKVSFDILTAVSLSGTNHDHDEPCHLVLKDDKVPTHVNLAKYGGPESRYCPARVYEFIEDDAGGQKLHINAQNCLHCKACDIKDPSQNITWTVPQGGGGPKYTMT